MRGREDNGHFAKGNRLWEARSSAGPKPKFSNPDDLMAACIEYFEWVDDNPLMEEKLMKGEGGKIERASASKMRAMTIGGLCNFLDVSDETWRRWRDTDLCGVVTHVERIIRTQKFEGASADLLNANIIARDLGLADRNEHSGPNGDPIQTQAVDMPPKELARQVAFLLAQGMHDD